MSKTTLTFEKYEPYFSFFLNWKRNNPSTWKDDKRILTLLTASREPITAYMLHSFSGINQKYIEYLLEFWHEFLNIEGKPKLYSPNSVYLRDFVKLPIATGKPEEEKQLKRELSEAFEKANKSICKFYVNREILKKIVNKDAKDKDESMLLNYAVGNLTYHIDVSHFSEKELIDILSLLIFDKEEYNLLYKIRKSYSQIEEYKEDLDDLRWKIYVMLEKKEGFSKIDENLKTIMDYYLEIMLLRAAMTNKPPKYQQDEPITPILRSKHYLLDELINISYETNNIRLFLGLADEFHIKCKGVYEEDPISLRFNIRNLKSSIEELKSNYLKMEVYTLLIDRLSAKRKKNSTVRKNLKDLKEELIKIKEEVNDSFMVYEVETYFNVAIKLYESGEIDKVENLIEKIKELTNKIKNIYFQKERAVILLIELLGRIDRIDEAIEIMKANDFEIIRTGFLVVIAEHLIKKGDIDKAIELTSTLEDRQYKAMTIYPVIIAELLRLGDAQRAINTLSKVAEDDLDKAEIFKVVVEYLTREGFLDNAIKALFTEESVNLNDRCTQSSIEFLKEATKIAESIKECLVQSEVYSIIATRLVELGFVDEAVRVLSEKVDVKNWEVETCHMIMNDLKKAGRIEDANKIADEAIKALEKVEGYDKAEMYSFVVANLAEIGREEEARKLMKKLHKIIDEEVERKDSEDFFKLDAYTGYAYRMAEIGKMDEAIRSAESLTNDGFRADVYFGIAGIFMKDGRIEEAIEITELIDYSYYQAESYANIVKKLTEAKDIDRALKIADKTNYISYRIEAYKTLADYFISINDIDKALTLADKIKCKPYKFKIYSHIAKRLAEMNNIQETKKVIEKIDINYYKAKSYFEASNILSKNGNIRSALEMVEKAKQNRF